MMKTVHNVNSSIINKTDHGTRFHIIITKLKSKVTDGLCDTFNGHPLIIRKPVTLYTQ